MFAFVKGKAYVATPTLKGPAQRVMACIEREPGRVAPAEEMAATAEKQQEAV